MWGKGEPRKRRQPSAEKIFTAGPCLVSERETQAGVGIEHGYSTLTRERITSISTNSNPIYFIYIFFILFHQTIF